MSIMRPHPADLPVTERADQFPPPIPAPVEVLREVVRRHGTPTYVYDLGQIRAQIARLKAALPPAVEVLYSLKANASLGLCSFIAAEGLGADVASAGELVTALEGRAVRCHPRTRSDASAGVAAIRASPAAGGRADRHRQGRGVPPVSPPPKWKRRKSQPSVG